MQGVVGSQRSVYRETVMSSALISGRLSSLPRASGCGLWPVVSQELDQAPGRGLWRQLANGLTGGSHASLLAETLTTYR